MKEASYVRLVRKGIRLLESTINMMVLLLFLSGIAFGTYAMWDSNQLYEDADTTQYAQYKPREKDTRSFAELKAINNEVIGWLSVYGTNIDYPLVQAEDNETYVNTSVTGEKVLSGSVFLDYRNQSNFSDFNSIIYGHHMSKQLMFGEIGEFQNEEYFKTHRYGKLYNGEREYGIEFFALVEADGYDKSVYAPAIMGVDRQQEYLARLLELALQNRKIEGGTGDRLVLLSTCTSSATNGRHILVGRLSDIVYDDPFIREGMAGKFGSGSFLNNPIVWLIVMIILVLMTVVVLLTRRQRVKHIESENEDKRKAL